MRTLFQSAVAADEIDGLGHLNVRYYIARALRANAALMDGLGLSPAALGARLVQADTYTRYHREQFQGSTLQVRGGVLEAHGERIRVYFEVCNDAKAEVAATFNITSIPTLMIIRDNIVLYAQPGALPEAALEELITKAEALDMDEVRASMEKTSAEA